MEFFPEIEIRICDIYIYIIILTKHSFNFFFYNTVKMINKALIQKILIMLLISKYKL